MLKLKKSGLFLLLIILLAFALRIYGLGKFPPALYSDEADQGYNAYSVLKTGRDEHGSFLPIAFRSFGDWKPPLPTYLMVPLIFFLGLNEISVRLPGTLLGILTVYITYLFAYQLLADSKNRRKTALLSALILAVSPWHILESRSAMLVAVFLFFTLCGAYFFIKGKYSAKFYGWGTLFLGMSLYSYYGARLIIPLLVLVLIFYNKLWLKIKTLSLLAVLGLIMIMPLILGFLKNPDVVFGRAKTVSVFYDQGTELRLWELISDDGINQPTSVSRFFHNRSYLYAKKIITNFFIHFDLNYLIIKGDESQPFNMPGMGIIYWLDGVFLIAGFYFLFRNSLKNSFFIITFLAISILPAALTFLVPASNRTFNAVFPFSLLIALGLVSVLNKLKFKTLFALFISVLYVLNISYFLKIYFIEIPKSYAAIWNFGWKEAVNIINNKYPSAENVMVSGKNGMPYIYFLFYNRYDPTKFQKNAVRNYKADRFGFESVDSFDRYYFPLDMDWNNIRENHFKNTVYVIPASEYGTNDMPGMEVRYPDGAPLLRFIKYD